MARRRRYTALCWILGAGLLSGSCGDSETAPAPVASVDVQPAAVTVVAGKTVQLSATPRDASGTALTRAVVWSSESVGIATVSATGVVTGVVPGGPIAITAQSGGKSGSAAITVTAGPVASVQFTPSSVTLDVGQSLTVTATVRDALGNAIPNKVVRWLTSDASVAGGTANGNTAILQAAAPGSAVVTADVDGVVGNLPVTVRTTPTPVASVTISPESATIGAGEVLLMVATMRDAQGFILADRTTSWTTSNPAVASGPVSANSAAVQGLSAGVTTISVTSEGITSTAVLKVVASSSGPIPLTCAGVAGGVLFGQDGQYLGRLTSQFDSQSILNALGLYGNQFSTTSMYNASSRYGSPSSSYSAFNALAGAPPILQVSGLSAGYVSKNTVKLPRIDPDTLRMCGFP